MPVEGAPDPPITSPSSHTDLVSEGLPASPAGPPNTSADAHTDHQDRRGTKHKWLDLLKQRLGTFLLTAFLALLTVFSKHLTEKIEFGLDRAHSRQESLAKLSDDLGIFLFDCELWQEDLAEGATKQTLMADVGDELNNSITRLRVTEYSNRAMIRYYWDAEKAQEFEGIMSDIKHLEPTFRELNSQLRDGSSDKFTKELREKASSEIESKLEPLQHKVGDFLVTMQ